MILDWWDGIDRETEEEEEVEENVKEEETGPAETQNPLSVLNPILYAALSSELFLQAWNSIQWDQSDLLDPDQKILAFCHAILYKLYLAANCCWNIHEYMVIN